MKAKYSNWVILKVIRMAARSDVAQIPKETEVLRRGAARSENDATAIYRDLRRVYYENAVAGRHAVAAALATVAADICRPWGEPFELRLAEALYLTADSRHRAGEPALAVLQESITIMERHLSVTGAPYAVALGLLADILHADGQPEAAIDAARRALDLELRFGSANVPAAKRRLATTSAAPSPLITGP